MEFTGNLQAFKTSAKVQEVWQHSLLMAQEISVFHERKKDISKG